MLQLKEITKSYTTGDFTQVALNGINLNFRKNEFVAILGQSGSGKTTCLNVIGGLDQYDSGDLIINGKSTKDFKDGEWDAYRNNSVGFIFQSYNLISHLSILDNVEMGMTLSGVSSAEKNKKALEVLERVGLKEHIYKKPNQLSGGQMQRVAIARALANDPDIILADEPTGALDSATSEQIMDLIKEIADDKLVIMVTHNPELAEKYADRIVNFKDGEVTHDSNPYQVIKEETGYQLKKTSMSFFTALKVSGKNIATKKWRTALTAFAASIGIIGIALILSLSSGFQVQIDQFQSDALSEFPVIISQSAMSMDAESMQEMRGQMQSPISGDREYTDSDEVYLYDSAENKITHTNKLTDEYLEYVNKIDPIICKSIGYTRMLGMNLLRETDGNVVPASVAVGLNTGGGSDQTNMQGMANMSSMNGVGLASYPEVLDDSEQSYLEKNYDVLAGSYPTEETDLVLVIDNKNQVDYTVLKNLGFDTDNIDSVKFADIVGTEFKLITNNDYYQKTEMGNFLPRSDYKAMYDSTNSITLKISGIVRLKPDVSLGILGNGIAYSDNLVQHILEIEKDSEIVKAQKDADHNVITMEKLDDTSKSTFLSYLGGDATPFMVYLYASDFESKEAVLSYLDEYNNGKAEEDTVIYTDLASSMTNMTSGIMDAITLVLIAFASISLIVSLIMIGIITYISVLERTKEIGVLRALGARKKDITRVFNAETFIIGACSGLMGIGIAYLLTIPMNIVLENMTGLSGVAQLDPLYALLLVTISVVLTLIGGTIPAKMAAKKDPVEALRTE
ncbi:ATP-binding cassette domain-containing protein [Tissierella sp. MSJ-40]|uniref:ATP-binding cassette domain-containing protein n=1 Tax=Tissierella simiarum TaxID=2841534 RepID=A0ABS6E3H5_9FIRM|nr:ABC transporter ATP-binding protein/permease [Tissierella simiarum]MBU5436809.1 ATP-binding cassette domain-containing protein [Tissierella simiarum]